MRFVGVETYHIFTYPDEGLLQLFRETVNVTEFADG
jgi:hypothetical protein